MNLQPAYASETTAPKKRSMRILYITDSIWGVGGAEACLLRLTERLQNEGHECFVLTFHSNEAARPFLDRFCCPVYHWQLNNMYDLNAIRIGRRLSRLIRKQQFDVVHTFFPTADLWAGSIAKLSGAKVLISSRRDMGILRTRKHHIGYRLLGGLFDQVQAVSECVRQYTIDVDKTEPEHTITIHNGIDSEFHVRAGEVARLRDSLGIRAGEVVITCVANFRHVKGIDVLVRAAAIVKKSTPHFRILLAGHHGINATLAYSDEVVALSKSLGLEDCIRFLGQVTEDVPELLAMSNVFVLPSRSEGLSNALLEAMRSGLPCVATSVGGNPEVVVEGETGFLVPPDNPEALAERLIVLLRDEGLRRRMGLGGRKRIEKHFTLDAMSGQVVAAYDQVLDSNRQRSSLIAAPQEKRAVSWPQKQTSSQP